MKKHTIILLIIILVGVILRLYGIWDFSFTHDELSAVSRLRFDTFSELIEKGVKIDGHPAGIQVFLWFWIKIFGLSEISLRIPFIIMGISCIPLIYFLTKKWFNATAGLFTAAIVAVSQYSIIYSIIARPYIPGLFFMLLLLIIWSRMVFERDYRWRNVILFGFFTAACAYINQFSMLTAFLTGVTGLFFQKKQTWIKYVIACLISAALYLPAIPIVLYQISMGGPGDWLPAPTPGYLYHYVRYLFHFSWITILAVAAAMLLSSKINKAQWNQNKIKIITAFILFLTPYIIGHIYSITLAPVLQYSVLIFSFPFLLLVAASFIDSEINIKKIVALFIILATLTYSLAVTREHYKLLSLQWFEKSVLKTAEWMEKKGENDVECVLNMHPLFVKYYEEKMGISLNNLYFPRECENDLEFSNKVAALESNYLVVAGLSDVQLEIIKHYYPVLLEYQPCSTTEIYVFAKMGTNIEGMQKFYSEEYLWDMPIPAENEFIHVKEYNLSELCPSRFTKIMLTFDYKSMDSTADYALVLQTSYKGNTVDWRCVKPNNYAFKFGDYNRAFLDFRYEILIKNSGKIPHYNVKIYLWNMGNKGDIQPVKCTLETHKGNPYIYSLVEKTW